MHLIKFAPKYDDYVWGGNAFEKKLGRDVGELARIAESREICDRPEHESIVCEGGAFSGMNIRELLEKHAAEIMGARFKKESRFPLVVKWLDCNQKLSIQVHPSRNAAAILESEEKSEFWYFAQVAENAEYIAGFSGTPHPKMALEKIERGEVDSSFFKIRKSHKGESIFIYSGCVHALCEGNLVLEIQQNSSTTYRLFDWNRLGADGKPRQLHIGEALESADISKPAPEPVFDDGKTSQILCENEFFTIRSQILKNGEFLRFDSNQQPRIISLVEGGALESENGNVLAFENALLPFASEFNFKAQGNCKVLITENFA